jgi:hypothetical protein
MKGTFHSGSGASIAYGRSERDPSPRGRWWHLLAKDQEAMGHLVPHRLQQPLRRGVPAARSHARLDGAVRPQPSEGLVEEAARQAQAPVAGPRAQRIRGAHHRPAASALVAVDPRGDVRGELAVWRDRQQVQIRGVVGAAHGGELLRRREGRGHTHRLAPQRHEGLDLVLAPEGADGEAIRQGWGRDRRSGVVEPARVVQMVPVLQGEAGLSEALDQPPLAVIDQRAERDRDAFRPRDLVRALAPGGVAAVFDHVGGPGLVDSWRLLGRGGVLVSYGSASTLRGTGHRLRPYLPLLARLLWWNLLPNGRRAAFYFVQRWPGRFREDLATVLGLLAAGRIEARVARRLPLARAAEALGLLDASAVTGKVVLLPQAAGAAGGARPPPGGPRRAAAGQEWNLTIA